MEVPESVKKNWFLFAPIPIVIFLVIKLLGAGGCADPEKGDAPQFFQPGSKPPPVPGHR